MIYGSVCSGIEAATVAWYPLGWRAAWYSEIEPFPCRLLKHYYPQTPNLGNMLRIHETEEFQKSDIDLLVGGTPCQSFSTAGLRGGLADARGNLALQFCRILAIKRPRWFVWENVPGVFSSFSYDEGGYRVDRKGRTDWREFTETADFAAIIAGFRECGYSVSWRTMDAQFFGVPQRRRRVFVVGHLGDDWRPSAAVLFDPKGMRGNLTKGRKKGTTVAALTKNGVGASGADDNQAQASHLVAGTIDASYGRLRGASGQDGGHGHSTLVYGSNNTLGPVDVTSAVNTSQRHDFGTENFVVTPINTQVGLREHKDGDATGLGIGEEGDPSYTIGKAHHHAVYFEPRVGRNGRGMPANIAAPLKAESGESGKGDGAPHVVYSIMPQNSGKDFKAREVQVTQPITTQQGISNNGGDVVQCASIVRRLTPLECERLQGFPDNYTKIPKASDSVQYSSIGNSMAVPVMRKIGESIDYYDKIFNDAT